MSLARSVSQTINQMFQIDPQSVRLMERIPGSAKTLGVYNPRRIYFQMMDGSIMVLHKLNDYRRAEVYSQKRHGKIDYGDQ